MIDQGKRVEIFRMKSSVPKYLLQGALFPVSKYPRLSGKQERLISTYSGQEIAICYEGFTQFDLAVSLAYKKIINLNKSFQDIKFTVADFARALNRKDGGKTRMYILDAFRRSNNFHLCFDFGSGRFFEGFRLDNFSETRTNEFKISFNMDYLSMTYSEDDVCEIDIDLFLSLQLGLQSWLYGFICATPYQTTIDLDDLHTYSGSNYKSNSDFKKAVKEVLNALYKKDVLGWRHGVTRDGMVFWEYNNLFKNMHQLNSKTNLIKPNRV